MDWMHAIQITKNTDFERNISFYLKKILKKKELKDIPCFIDESVLENAWIESINYYAWNGNDDNNIAGHVQALAPIVNDDLIVNGIIDRDPTIVKHAITMYKAASNGNLKFIKAPCTSSKQFR